MAVERLTALAETAEKLAAEVPVFTKNRTPGTEPWELGVYSLWMACYGPHQNSPMDPEVKSLLAPLEVQPVHEHLFQVMWNGVQHRHEDWGNAKTRLTAVAAIFRDAAKRLAPHGAQPADAPPDLVAWLDAQVVAGERLLREELAVGPRHYFYERNSSDHAVEFYSRLDMWRGWASSLVTGLRARVPDAGHLCDDALERFDTRHFLRFRIATFRDPAVVLDVDLSAQARYLSGTGWSELRTAFERGRGEEPSWHTVLDTMARSLRSFSAMVHEQAADLNRLASRRLGERRSAAVVAAATVRAVEVKTDVRFVSLEWVAEGAYGEVWRAYDSALKRDVAIKFLRATGATTDDVLKTARALTRVQHANIVTVYDVTSVVDPANDALATAIIMEWVDGETLQSRLRRRVDLEEAERIGYSLIAAVREYHERGFSHSDLHDQNILVGSAVVKIVDPLHEGSRFQPSALRSLQDRDLRYLRDLLSQVLECVPSIGGAAAHFREATRGASLPDVVRSFERAVDQGRPRPE